MLRRFFTPRWVALHLLTIAIVVLFCFFGRWQLHRWEGRGTTVLPPDSRPPVELAALEAPGEPLPGGSIGRQVTLTGRFDAAHQVLVPNRSLAGRPGFWVVTPLRGATGEQDAAALVVRGWVPSPNDPAVLDAPPAPVSVSGRLYAAEDPPPAGTESAALPPGQVREVNTAELTGNFPYRILDGYVQLGSQSPTATGPAPTLLPVPVRTENRGGGIRNLAYAVQWWMFALAVLYFWGKLIREDLRDEPAESERPAEQPQLEPRPSSPARPLAPVGAADTADDPSEDAELAAYNRYLAQLNAQSGRTSR